MVSVDSPGFDGESVAPNPGCPTESVQPESTRLYRGEFSAADGHSHSHSHASASRRRLGAALGVTLSVLVAELFGAFLSGSLSMAADAGHMAVDSSGLIVALIAAHMMTRPRTDSRTWGYARAEAISAALQAGMLLVICVVVAFHAIQDLFNPPQINGRYMLIIGVIGLFANVISLFILSGGRGESLNMRAAFLEVLNDALGSVAVITAGIITLSTGWVHADAIASLLIVALMFPRALALAHAASSVLMEHTPIELDLSEVRQHILSLPEVLDLHDLHVSTIQTGLVTLTAHVTVAQDMSAEKRASLLHHLEKCAQEHFPVKINHTTFQFDPPSHFEHENICH